DVAHLGALGNPVVHGEPQGVLVQGAVLARAHADHDELLVAEQAGEHGHGLGQLGLAVDADLLPHSAPPCRCFSAARTRAASWLISSSRPSATSSTVVSPRNSSRASVWRSRASLPARQEATTDHSRGWSFCLSMVMGPPSGPGPRWRDGIRGM